MALPGEVQVGRFSRFFSKFTGSKGPSGRFTFGTEIVPTLSLWTGAENRFLESWYRFTQFWNQAALANNPSVVVLRNPLNSGIVCVIEKFILAVSAADVVPPTNFLLFQIAADQATVLGSATSVDKRAGRASAMIASRGNAAVATHVGQIPSLLANTPFDLLISDIQEWGPILPGDGFGFQTGAPAGGVAVSAFVTYRERSLEDSELT